MLQYFIDREFSIKNEVLSGITVALALIPESLTFSYLAGVHPLTAINSAILLNIAFFIIGGRPGAISGFTSAMAVVAVKIVGDHGLTYLFSTVILAGVFQTFVGVFKLGKFIRLIPRTVILGFVSGMAIRILLRQMDYLTLELPGSYDFWLKGEAFWSTILLALLGGAIINFFPRLTKQIPASLVAVVVISLIVALFHIDSPNLLEYTKLKGAESFELLRPQLIVLPENFVSFDTLKIIFVPALIMALIGLTQSLMTLNLIDELTETRGNANKESIALGLANIISGLSSGIGGAALLGQSVVNVKSGGRGRLSLLVVALSLFILLNFGGDLIAYIPLAALISVMLMMVIGTFAWSSIRILSKIPKTDAFTIIVVCGLTITFNETLGVVLGIIFASLVFAWENAIRIRVRHKIDKNGINHYEVFGPLFFGSTSIFMNRFNLDQAGAEKEVVINFYESRVWDHSGIEAIYAIASKYSKAGCRVSIIHLSRDSRLLLKKVGIPENVSIVEDRDDPRYKVATNYPTEQTE